MNTLPPDSDIFDRLRELHRLCPDFRVAQLIAAVGDVAVVECGYNLGDLEDDDFDAAIERFGSNVAHALGLAATPAR